jgi:hypothetical protein
MARKKRTVQQLEGADEFMGTDPEKEAIEKVAAARAAATKEEKNGDNGGPIMDEAAWSRASVQLVAEQIELDALAEKVAEVRGRISSIKKVAEKCGVDWDVVKLYAKYQKRIRIGEMGAVVTEQRRLASLMKIMDCPLSTQWNLFPELPTGDDGAPAKPGMDAELQGQHAYSNREDRENNPFAQGTDAFVAWDSGWNNAQAATAREMGPSESAAH